MSKPSALPSPESRASSPAPDRAPGGAGEHAPGAGPRRLGGRRDAARRQHHGGLGQPALGRAPRRAGRGSGRAAGRGRRRSPSSSSARTRGTAAAPRRGGDVDPVEALAQALGDRALVARARGRRTAGRSRPTRRRAPPPRRRSGRARRRSSASITPPGPTRSPASIAVLRRHQRGRLGRAEVVEARAGSGGAISSRSAKPRVATSAVRAPRCSSSALVPTVIPWANALDVARLRRRRAASAASIAVEHAARTGRRASSAPWPCRARSPSKTTASVKVPPTSTPSSISGLSL